MERRHFIAKIEPKDMNVTYSLLKSFTASLLRCFVKKKFLSLASTARHFRQSYFRQQINEAITSALKCRTGVKSDQLDIQIRMCARILCIPSYIDDIRDRGAV